MKKTICGFLLVFILASAASASSLECSSADAQTRLNVGQYEGGARPRPGQRLAWSDLILDGVTYENATYAFAKKKTLSKAQDAFYVTETFVAQIRVEAKDGNKAEAIVLCDSKTYIGPPRP